MSKRRIIALLTIVLMLSAALLGLAACDTGEIVKVEIANDCLLMDKDSGDYSFLYLDIAYDSGKTKTVRVKNGMIKEGGGDVGHEGKYTLRIEYKGFYIDCTVIKIDPSKLELTSYDSFIGLNTQPDYSGWKVTYDGKEYALDRYAVDIDTSVKGERDVEVTVAGRKFTVKVNVDVAVEYAAFTSMQSTIRLGEDLDLGKWTITVKYTDGSTVTVPVTRDMIAPYDLSSAGVKNVVVNYAGMEIRTTVRVVGSEEDGALLSYASRAYYVKGSGDLSLPINGGVTTVSAPALYDSHYTLTDSELTIKESYLSQLPKDGRITVRIGNSERYDEIVVAVADKAKPSFASPYNEYRMSTGVLSLDCDLAGTSASGAKISVDGVLSTLTSNGTFGSGSLTFSKYFIDELDAGLHYITVHFSNGSDMSAYVNVVNDTYKPYDLKVSYDNVYPNIVLSWQSGVECDYASVNVNGSEIKVYGGAETVNIADYLSENNKISVTNVVGGKEYASEEITYVKNIENEEFLLKKFEFLGDIYDFNITSYGELKELVQYFIVNITKMGKYPDVSDYDGIEEHAFRNGKTAKAVTFTSTVYSADNTSPLQRDIDKAIKEYGEAVKKTGSGYFIFERAGEAIIWGAKLASTNVPDASYTDTDYVDQDRRAEPYATAEPRPADHALPIDSVEETAVVYLSDELYMAAQKGYRPVPIEGSPAYNIYEAARRVNRQIIDDGMSTLEKYRAIFEWICYNVKYDYATADLAGSLRPSDSSYDVLYSKRCFYLEGVFEDKVAVCNGLAKAVALMCAIEGIPCVKVNGSVSSGNHAWNKAFINGRWYISDPTWGNMKSTVVSGDDAGTKEVFNFYYMLGNRSDVGSGHSAKNFEEFYSNETYDYFASDIIAYDSDGDGKDELYSTYVTEESVAAKLIEYTLKSGKETGSLHLFGAAAKLYDENGAVSGYVREILDRYGYRMESETLRHGPNSFAKEYYHVYFFTKA